MLLAPNLVPLPAARLLVEALASTVTIPILEVVSCAAKHAILDSLVKLQLARVRPLSGPVGIRPCVPKRSRISALHFNPLPRFRTSLWFDIVAAQADFDPRVDAVVVTDVELVELHVLDANAQRAKIWTINKLGGPFDAHDQFANADRLIYDTRLTVQREPLGGFRLFPPNIVGLLRRWACTDEGRKRRDKDMSEHNVLRRVIGHHREFQDVALCILRFRRGPWS
mmetsp:Transcript_28882/g.51649  ORF Transcript_28882/g.51649 Transcript_28882/m.51649 type:complete len:225 (-) Transcript_28882:148-822(-)